MDELELLKKDWQKGAADFKSYSDTDIYPMLHKKSSSIVKTLFYISICELVFWLLASVLPYALSPSIREKLDKSYENPLFIAISIFSYAVILVFIYLLFLKWTHMLTSIVCQRYPATYFPIRYFRIQASLVKLPSPS